MCKVYNTIGSLTSIKKHLTQTKIDDFNSLGELLSFRDNYATARQQIISNHEILVTEERNNLRSEVLRLENEIAISKLEIEQKLKTELEILNQKLDEVSGMEKSLLQEFTYSFVIVFFMLKIKYKELSYEPSPTLSPTRLSSCLSDFRRKGMCAACRGRTIPRKKQRALLRSKLFIQCLLFGHSQRTNCLNHD